MITHSPILERVIKPDLGDLTPDAAKQFLQFNFTDTDRSRYLAVTKM